MMMNNINTKRVRFWKPNTFKIEMIEWNGYKIKKRCLTGTAFETFAFSLPKVKTNFFCFQKPTSKLIGFVSLSTLIMVDEIF